jgi:hypothetical protein
MAPVLAPGAGRFSVSLALFGLQRADLMMLGLYILGAALLFRLTLFEGWTFVGDSDRLNTFLNVRLFEVVSIQARGTVPTWSDQQFMGTGMAGLHWMLPGISPFPYLVALFPLSQAFQVSNVITISLLVMATWGAYLALRAYSRGPGPAAVGGLLYGTSAYAVHRLAQVDASFSVLIAVPLLLMLARRARRATAPAVYLGLVACWAALIQFTFLQEVAYVALLFGAYVLYRAIRLRDPAPLVVCGLAFVSALVLALPRLLTVAADFQQLARSSVDFEASVAEALRYFDDGVLGRIQQEEHLLRGPALNLHEGIQLLDSSLAALAAIAVAVFARSRVMRLLGIAVVMVLSVALVIWWRPFYDSLGRPAFPSREGRVILMNVLLFGLPLWLVGSWLARRSPTRQSSAAPVSAATTDGPFFIGFLMLALFAILIPEGHRILYYGFLKVDFTHTRLSIAALFPMAALATVYLSQFCPPVHRPLAWRWLGAGLVVGLGLWLLREGAASLMVERVGPAIEVLRPRRLFTLEAARVASSLLVVLVAQGALRSRMGPSALMLVGAALAGWMVLETGASAEFKLNGDHTIQQAFPFETFNYLNVPPGQLRVPTPAERTAVQARLDVEQYRAVMWQDMSQFVAQVEPHLTAFWGLRAVEGYGFGLPRRLQALPFDEAMISPHNLNFDTSHDLPWHLLAALNVKYAVVVDRSFWFNAGPGGPDRPFDVQRLQVLENPFPVTPRVFFARRVSPAGATPRFPGDDGQRPAPPDPLVDEPSQHSVAEGWEAERQFSTAGALDATFDGDHITVQVEPSSEERYLVLNEQYHPAWQAWIDGQPARIYATNLVMRGLVVPPGATRIELRFVPFLVSASGLSLMALGLLVIVASWWGLQQWTSAEGGRWHFKLLRRAPAPATP